MKEFNLSNFRQMEQNVWTYEEEQVKEFIKRLKEDLEINLVQVLHILSLELRYIDKISGDKLT